MTRLETGFIIDYVQVQRGDVIKLMSLGLNGVSFNESIDCGAGKANQKCNMDF